MLIKKEVLAQKAYLSLLAKDKRNIKSIREEAVRTHIFELTAEQAKAANANVSEQDLATMVEEAVEWARSH